MPSATFKEADKERMESVLEGLKGPAGGYTSSSIEELIDAPLEEDSETREAKVTETHEEWEEEFEKEVSIMAKRKMKETPAFSVVNQYGSNLSDIKSTLANDAPKPSLRRFTRNSTSSTVYRPSTPKALEGRTVSLSYASDSADTPQPEEDDEEESDGDEGRRASSWAADLKRQMSIRASFQVMPDVSGLQQAKKQQDVLRSYQEYETQKRAQELLKTNESLQQQIRRLQSEVSILREVVSDKVRQSSLFEFKTECFFHRAERMELYNTLIVLATSEDGAEGRKRVLSNCLKSFFSAFRSTVHINDIAVQSPMEYQRIPDIVMQLLNGQLTHKVLPREVASEIENQSINVSMAGAHRSALISLRHERNTVVHRPPEGRVTFVGLQIEGLSPLLPYNSQVVHEAIVIVVRLLQELLQQFNGYMAKAGGDCYVVSFGSARDAAGFAVAVQLRLIELDWPTAVLAMPDAAVVRDERFVVYWRGLRAKVGVHVGRPSTQVEPTSNRLQYFGNCVVLACRLTAFAAPGQILCSGDIHEEIQHTLDALDAAGVSMESHGVHAFRRCGAPILVYELRPLRLKAREFPPLGDLIRADAESESPGRSRIERFIEVYSPPIQSFANIKGAHVKALTHIREFEDDFRMVSRLAHQNSLSVAPPSTDPFYCVFLEIDSLAILHPRASQAVTESTVLCAKLFRQVLLRFRGFEVASDFETFVAAFSDVAIAVNYCLTVHQQLLVLDWPEVFAKFPQTRTVESKEGGGKLVWKGLNIRSGIVSAPLAALTKGSKPHSVMLAHVKLLAEVTHPGQIVATKEVHDKVIRRDRKDLKLQVKWTEFVKVIFEEHGAAPAQLFHLVPFIFDERFSKFRKVKNTPQPSFSNMIADMKAKANAQLEDVQIAEQKLKSMRSQEFACGTGVESTEVFFVMTEVFGVGGLWRQNILAALQAMELCAALIRQLRDEFAGYEADQEGSSFWLAFPTMQHCLQFCLQLQLRLLTQAWPAEILATREAGEESDPYGRGTKIFRGLRVQVAAHCGFPLREKDPLSGRVSYQGIEVATCAAMLKSAKGGQILLSEALYEKCDRAILSTLDAVTSSSGTVLTQFTLGTAVVSSPTLVYQLLPKSLDGRSFETAREASINRVEEVPGEQIEQAGDGNGDIASPFDEFWGSHMASIVHQAHKSSLANGKESNVDIDYLSESAKVSVLETLSDSDPEDKKEPPKQQGYRGFSAIMQLLEQALRSMNSKKYRAEARVSETFQEENTIISKNDENDKKDSWDPAYQLHLKRLSVLRERHRRQARFCTSMGALLSDVSLSLDRLNKQQVQQQQQSLQQLNRLNAMRKGSVPIVENADSKSDGEGSGGDDEEKADRIPESPVTAISTAPDKAENKEEPDKQRKSTIGDKKLKLKKRPGGTGNLHTNCVDETYYNQMRMHKLVLRAMLMGAEQERMYREDRWTMYNLTEDPSPEVTAWQCFATFSEAAAARRNYEQFLKTKRQVRKIREVQNAMQATSKDSAAAMLRLHKRVRLFIQYLKTFYSNVENGQKAVSEDDFILEWVRTCRKLKHEEDEEDGVKKQKEKIKSTRVEFKEQYSAALETDMEEHNAKEDWKRLHSSVIGILLKFFLFSKGFLRRINVKRGAAATSVKGRVRERGPSTRPGREDDEFELEEGGFPTSNTDGSIGLRAQPSARSHDGIPPSYPSRRDSVESRNANELPPIRPTT